MVFCDFHLFSVARVLVSCVEVSPCIAASCCYTDEQCRLRYWVFYGSCHFKRECKWQRVSVILGGHEVLPWNATAQFRRAYRRQTKYKVFLWRRQHYYAMRNVFAQVKQMCPVQCTSNTFLASWWLGAKSSSSRTSPAMRAIIEDQGKCWKQLTWLLSSMFRSSFLFHESVTPCHCRHHDTEFLLLCYHHADWGRLWT